MYENKKIGWSWELKLPNCCVEIGRIAFCLISCSTTEREKKGLENIYSGLPFGTYVTQRGGGSKNKIQSENL